MLRYPNESVGRIEADPNQADRFGRDRSAALARDCPDDIETILGRSSALDVSAGIAHSAARRRPASRGESSNVSPSFTQVRSTSLKISASFLVSRTFNELAPGMDRPCVADSCGTWRTSYLMKASKHTLSPAKPQLSKRCAAVGR